MPESNHAALGQGLKIFTDAMRRLTKERLIARYPNSWWESGVIARLTDVQRNALRRDMEKDPSRDRAEFLEAAHFVRIVTQEFDHAFHGVFTEGGFADFLRQAQDERFFSASTSPGCWARRGLRCGPSAS